jgi:hypothetical protein
VLQGFDWLVLIYHIPTPDVEKSSLEIDGQEFVLWDAIQKGRTWNGSFSFDADGSPDYGEGRNRPNLTENNVLFVGDEKNGEGKELLEELKNLLNNGYSVLEKAITDDKEANSGSFANWPSDDVTARMGRLKEHIASTSYLTKLGNFVMFNGPCTILWDTSSNAVYFCTNSPNGGSIWRADFNDRELFVPIYFAG